MYTPLGNRVIVEPLKPEEKTKGGIILSEDSQKKTVLKGTILEVGKGVEVVEKGDVVLFSSFNYEEIEEKVFCVEESNLLAKFIA